MMEEGRQKGEGGNTCRGSQNGGAEGGGGEKRRQMGERQIEVWVADRRGYDWGWGGGGWTGRHKGERCAGGRGKQICGVCRGEGRYWGRVGGGGVQQIGGGEEKKKTILLHPEERQTKTGGEYEAGQMEKKREAIPPPQKKGNFTVEYRAVQHNTEQSPGTSKKV